jgi:hypothetical protein
MFKTLFPRSEERVVGRSKDRVSRSRIVKTTHTGFYLFTTGNFSTLLTFVDKPCGKSHNITIRKTIYSPEYT